MQPFDDRVHHETIIQDDAAANLSALSRHVGRAVDGARHHCDYAVSVAAGDSGGADQRDAPSGELGVARPHLLPGDEPAAVDRFGPGAQRCEIGPGVGLGEELAPDLRGVEDRRQPSPLLFLGAALANRVLSGIDAYRSAGSYNRRKEFSDNGWRLYYSAAGFASENSLEIGLTRRF